MSDLPSSRRLKPNASQLPVSWYFDPQVFELEQRLLFANSPGYVGHELMVPNPGDYHTLAWMDHGKVLVRNANGIELLSNVCRHRQAILLEGRGNAHNIVCPLHRVEIKEFEQNWKTFIEVYLEDYHVIPYHPGLGNFVTCDDLKWDIADTYSAQVVGVKDGFARAGTPTYAKWHEALTRFTA